MCNSKFRFLTSFSDGLLKMTESAAFFFANALSCSGTAMVYVSATCSLKELGAADVVGLNMHTKVRLLKLVLELVSKELNHLVAILHVYARGLIFMGYPFL